MSNLIVSENRSVANAFNQEKIALIKNTVAKEATDLELQFFIEQCKRTGLDPITRQIYFIKNPADGKVQVQTSIDGFRLVAERSGVYEGQTTPMWCGTDGVWKDVWLSKTPPSACKIGVYKKGFRDALYAIALFDEYAQKKRDGSLSFMWGKMPALMIAKVAESLALRKAFPNDLSGLYTQEEMSQATPEEKSVKKITMPTATTTAQVASEAPSHVAETPQQNSAMWEEANPQDANPEANFLPDWQSYVIPFGKKHKGKTLEEVGPQDVANFSAWLQNSASEAGKPLQGDALMFVQMADSYLRAVKSGV